MLISFTELIVTIVCYLGESNDQQSSVQPELPAHTVSYIYHNWHWYYALCLPCAFIDFFL